MPAIGRHKNLRAKHAPRKALRQRRPALPRRERSVLTLKVEEGHRRPLLLDRIEPAAVGMQIEVPRPIARRHCHRRLPSGLKRACLGIERPDEDAVEPKVNMQHEATVGGRLDHVGVGAVVAAEGEAAGRSVRCRRRPDLTLRSLHVRRLTEPAILVNRQHSHRPAKVVGHQQMPATRMQAHIGRPGGSRRNGVEHGELAGRPVECIAADGALAGLAHAVGLVGGIHPRALVVDHEAARAGAELKGANARKRSGCPVDAKAMNAAAVARRKIHLRGQHIAQRRTKCADIGKQRRHIACPGLRRTRRPAHNRQHREPRHAPHPLSHPATHRHSPQHAPPAALGPLRQVDPHPPPLSPAPQTASVRRHSLRVCHVLVGTHGQPMSAHGECRRRGCGHEECLQRVDRSEARACVG